MLGFGNVTDIDAGQQLFDRGTGKAGVGSPRQISVPEERGDVDHHQAVLQRNEIEITQLDGRPQLVVVGENAEVIVFEKFRLIGPVVVAQNGDQVEEAKKDDRREDGLIQNLMNGKFSHGRRSSRIVHREI